jgi:chaperone required for assembly of F1-ATPase
MKNDEPHFPKDTCPYIDLVKTLIDDMAEEGDTVWRQKQSALAMDILEYVRDSNFELRQAMIHWKNKARKKT